MNSVSTAISLKKKKTLSSTSKEPANCGSEKRINIKIKDFKKQLQTVH
jgi:hypothetical protein